jgi:eukaryotic-like serine/threonine-protein kinase
VIGELIDHYRVLELVGCGAMGVVYKALDVNLDRPVAVKVMGAAARNEPDFVERFRQEARLQAALNHPNVAQLFDYFVHDGAPVAVMEFIDGESFEQLIRRRGAIPAHEALPLFRQALLGVAAAHRAGIIHRDLKPSNLMIARDGTVKVMDFGIARRQDATGATRFGSTSIGSPLYMAPEQILGRPIDCRTDVYALGVTLYELVSGQKPFNPRGKTEYSLLNAHVNDLPEPPTVHCRDIPGPVVDVVLRALAKEPEARFQSVDELIHALPDASVPDAAPNATAPDPAVRAAGPTGTVVLKAAAPRVGPTGTVALNAAAPAPAAPHVNPSDTVAIEYSPPMSEEPVDPREPGGTLGFEYAASTRRDPRQTLAFDYFAATLRRESDRSTPSSATASSMPAPARTAQNLRGTGLMRVLRAHRVGLGAGLLAALVVGTVIRHAQRPHWPPPSASVQTPASTEPAASPSATPGSTAEAPAAAPLEGSAATATAATAMPSPAATAPASPPDLSGTWRGEYVDASGRQLLRVVTLSISRVGNDGGIEGTLQYQAASGEGECKLHPRGSSYSPGEQRLQLSPEGCSPHYPRELGVPLDFDGVNPQANVLNNGRIEAPTGAVIHVRLRRVS